MLVLHHQIADFLLRKNQFLIHWSNRSTDANTTRRQALTYIGNSAQGFSLRLLSSLLLITISYQLNTMHQSSLLNKIPKDLLLELGMSLLQLIEIFPTHNYLVSLGLLLQLTHLLLVLLHLHYLSFPHFRG